MNTNVDKETGSQVENETVQRVASELKPLLVRTGKEHALARYALGLKVNELEKDYGNRAIEKLARALGRGYGADNLRIFARIARTWTQAEFEPLVEGGLEVSDFRELWKLAKVSDEATCTRVAQQAVENSWPIETLKEEVRKTIGQVQPRARTKRNTAEAEREKPVLTVSDALTALITGKQPRLDEHVRLRAVLDQIALGEGQALTAQTPCARVVVA